MRGTVGLQGPGPQTTVVFSKMLRGGASNEIGKLTGEWALVSVTLDDVKQSTSVVSVAALLDTGGTGGNAHTLTFVAIREEEQGPPASTPATATAGTATGTADPFGARAQGPDGGGDPRPPRPRT